MPRNGINFFDKKYKPQTTRDSRFGICDEEPACLNHNEKEEGQWGAKVNNKRQREILFVPIDKNITIKRDNGEEESRCDGLLHISESKTIIFVELKDKQKRWQSKAILQLENTIQIFKKHHSINDFKGCYAYACNKQFPNRVPNYVQKKKFIASTGFDLFCEDEIEIN
ncbi:MAG: hypothetical protein LBL74_01630 [Bacteroidales bacterium]|jgi:hypothetical protein|nr:hypothetical protein [Bacteroidales bacterium]